MTRTSREAIIRRIHSQLPKTRKQLEDHINALAKTEAIEMHRDISGHLYTSLTILDTKSASLLQFASILIAVYSIYLVNAKSDTMTIWLGMAPEPPIDPLSLFARFGREQRVSLRDPKSLELFSGFVKQWVAEALDNDALLHGQRTQNMFEALVISLGHYKLLKVEDTGRVHPEGKFVAPDFRVVLDDGRQWLVEVKNVYDREPSRQRLRLREIDITQRVDYAAAMGCPLKLALYWARWRVWTEVVPVV